MTWRSCDAGRAGGFSCLTATGIAAPQPRRAGKAERLAQAGADAVITRLADITEAITAEAVRT